MLVSMSAGRLRIVEGDAAVELDTEAAARLLQQLTGYLPQMPAPDLVGIDGSDIMHCPHCEAVLELDTVGGDLVELDASVRRNEAGRAENGDVIVSTEDGDFHTMVFLCGHCGHPVNIPGHVGVTWG